MSFLTGLANIGTGAQQGYGNMQDIRQKAQAIQQGQMALDAAKKQLAADPAVAAWLSSAQGGQSAPPMALPGPTSPPPPAQPMPPGQASVPAQPQAGPAPQPPQGQTPSPGQGQPAPSPQQGGGGSLPQQPGQGEDPSSPQAAFKVMQTVAQQIKAANPNIDPTTLLYATQKAIDMSKGIEPGLRAQASFLANQLRAQVSMRNTDVRAAEQEDVAGKRSADVGARAASQEKIAAGHDATSIRRVQQQGEQAMARTQAAIDGANQRAKDGVWSREKTVAYKERANAAGVKLKAANSRLTALTNAGVKPDDPRVAAATRDITSAVSELDRVNKAAKVDDGSSSSGGGLPSDLPDPKGHAEGSTAKDDTGKVVAVIKNGAWAAP